MARTQKDIKLVVGGESRVDLLPPEVASRAQAKAARQAMVALVVASVVLCGAGWAGAVFMGSISAQGLASEQSRTTMLLKQQGEFSEVSRVETQLITGVAAAQIGAATEVNWKSFVGDVQERLPEGVVIETFSSDTATPLEAYEQSESPLQGTRIATLVFAARSADLPQVERWLISLEGIVGFADATPGSITTDDEPGYLTTVTMHINTAAYSGRFATPAETEETE